VRGKADGHVKAGLQAALRERFDKMEAGRKCQASGLCKVEKAAVSRALLAHADVECHKDETWRIPHTTLHGRGARRRRDLGMRVVPAA
jgi:hypothetical protein